MTQLIDKKRFMYLHKILIRDKEHWTNKMLYQLREDDLGWSKNIMKKLTDWETIKKKDKRRMEK